MKRIISIILTILLTLQSHTFAQVNLSNLIPINKGVINLTPAYQPSIMKGLKFFSDNPFHFDFIIKKGDEGYTDASSKMIKESEKLIRYFLSALTIPKKNFWVNLNPKEPDRIISDKFGQTEMGRDLLAQDYVLKQLTASLMYPEDEIGRKFWDKIYAKLYAKYGHTNIPVNTFNRIWIVPEKSTVFETKDKAFVVDAKLKVMLEDDYFIKKDINLVNLEDQNSTEIKEIIRKVILPEISHEVNEGKHFAKLRQIHHSLILATWFKQRLKESLLGQIYVDQEKVSGIDIKDTEIKEKIYDQYIKIFKD